MTIILILSAIVVGVSRGISQKQARSRATTELATLAGAMEAYKMRYGDYPMDVSNEDLFQLLVGARRPQVVSAGGSVTIVYQDLTTAAAQKYQKPFIDASAFATIGSGNSEKLIDPWGSEYEYYYKDGPADTGWTSSGFILMSRGADGQSRPPAGFKQGEISDDYHISDDLNVDDIVYGQEF